MNIYHIISNNIGISSTMDNKTDTIKSFVLYPIDGKLENVKDFTLDTTKEDELKASKHLLDEPYNNNSTLFYCITKHFDIASRFRATVSRMYNTKNVSKAWLKGYEMMMHYNLIPTTNRFLHFDNAAFPGAFILAAWHLSHTISDVKDYDWHASSLLPQGFYNKKSHEPLADTYLLHKNYPDRWTMNKDNNGDVRLRTNQEHWEKKFMNGVDLYTSDLGFDVSKDYNKQEEQHAHANMGQILTGLCVLKNGGNMITKQFTHFLPFTVSILGILTVLFERVELCKPMFSSPSNSETYVVCLRYLDHPQKGLLIQRLMNRLDNFSLKPLIDKSSMNDGFLRSIYTSQTYFANTQIKRIKDVIAEYNRIVRSRKTSAQFIKNNNRFAKDNARLLRLWERNNPLIKMKDCRQINTLEKHIR